jgi:hypothetical protein
MLAVRRILALAALCGLALSQTPLTIIQDTLFKADGTKFSGTLTIQWSTFDASNLGTVVQQNKSVTVSNGNLQVQLAPNAGAPAPANVYTVTYQSDGRQQFTETWTIPVSGQPLTVSAVRTATYTTTTSAPSGASGQTPIPEASVIGLQADLNQRPTKGAGYGSNGVAIVDDNGILQTAAGQAGDCVLVDGTTGHCGAPSYSDAETPGGIVDGVNDTFTLANLPSGTSLTLFRNGLYMTAGFDYNLTGASVQFVPGGIPQPGDTLIASYRIDPASNAGNIGALTTTASVRATAIAQVLCSAAGSSSGSTSWTSLGSCDIPIAQLKTGDRIEARFTIAHTGIDSGYGFQVNWGGTTVISRNAGARDAAVTGTIEASITDGSAQLSGQSWGTVLPLSAKLLSAPAQGGIRVAFRTAMTISDTDTVKLVNFTILRYPAN